MIFFIFFPAPFNLTFSCDALDFAQLVKISLSKSILVFHLFPGSTVFFNPSFQHLFQSFDFQNAHELLIFQLGVFYRRH